MKYFLSLIQFIVCSLICVVLAGLLFFYSFRISFTREIVIKYLMNDKNISVQKDKITQDLISVSNANGLEPSIFDGFVTNEMVINNNKDYMNGIFDYIVNPNSVFPSTTRAAEDFEKGIKEILINYGKKIDPDQYIITEKGVASFAALEKLTFFKSAPPVIGFETLSGYMQKIHKLSPFVYYYGVLCILILFGLLLLLNKSKRSLSFVFLFYASCSAGIFAFFISKAILWYMSSDNSILQSTYLIDVVKTFLNKGAFLGATLFIGSQVLLIALFLAKKRLSKANKTISNSLLKD